MLRRHCVARLTGVAVILAACGGPRTGVSSQLVGAPPQSASKLSGIFATVANRVSPAVVSIRTETRARRQPSLFDFFRGPAESNQDNIARGNGSGAVIGADGYILTNNHVIADATRIDVIFKSGEEHAATVVGIDEATDLAVIRVKQEGLTPLGFADSNMARVGEWVLAVGSPFGLDYTVTAGVLSATGRADIGANEIEDYLQTDASINPGNSGGPLINLKGEIIGINTMVVGRGSGIGFAVPSNIARVVSDQLIQHGVVRRPWVGIGFQPLTPDLARNFSLAETRGALVSNVTPGGPAARAGLQPGDVIVSIDTVAIRDGRDLLRKVLSTPVGRTMALKVVREGKAQRFKLVTQSSPNARASRRPQELEARRSLGLAVETLSAPLAQRLQVPMTAGAVVTRVDAGSQADRAGLLAGDVIVEADRRKVHAAKDIDLALRDGEALLRVQRQEGAFYAVLKR